MINEALDSAERHCNLPPMHKRTLLVVIIAAIMGLALATNISAVIGLIERLSTRPSFQRTADANPLWWLQFAMPSVLLLLSTVAALLLAWFSDRIAGAASLALLLTLCWFMSERTGVLREMLAPVGLDYRAIGLVQALLLLVPFALVLRIAEQQRAKHAAEPFKRLTDTRWFWAIVLAAGSGIYALHTWVLLDISNQLRASVGSPPAQYPMDAWRMIGPIYMNPVGIVRRVFNAIQFFLTGILVVLAWHNLLRAYVAAELPERTRIGWLLVVLQYWTLFIGLIAISTIAPFQLIDMRFYYYQWSLLLVLVLLVFASVVLLTRRPIGRPAAVRFAATIAFALLLALIVFKGTTETLGAGMSAVLALAIAALIYRLTLRGAARTMSELRGN